MRVGAQAPCESVGLIWKVKALLLHEVGIASCLTEPTKASSPVGQEGKQVRGEAPEPSAAMAISQATLPNGP